MAKSRKKPKVKARSYAVFISHSSSDLWIAEQVAKLVGGLGAKVWLDKKDLKGGDVMADAIIGGIDACDEALVLVSPKSVKSHWVIYEIGAVSGQHKRVTPILNQVDPNAIAPMKGVKSIDLNQFDDFLIQLKKRVNEQPKTKG
ncbi:MAG: toll/interleukin-1 receptor domain-containing protein [Blastocatellia bacterium]